MLRIVRPFFHLGDAASLAEAPENFAILSATKTVHKAVVGYEGWAAPQTAEYLFAYSGERRMALNMIDGVAPDPTMIRAGLNFLRAHYPHSPLLIHCNLGRSRSVLLGALFIRNLLPEIGPQVALDLLERAGVDTTLMHPALHTFLMETSL